MIEEQEIDGRLASVVYLTKDWKPARKDEAALIKIIWRDTGERVFLAGPGAAADPAK